MGFLGPLRRSASLKEDERPDEFVTPLELIDKAQFELGKVRPRFHRALSLSGGSDLFRQDTPREETACKAPRRRTEGGRGQTAWIACRVEGTYCTDT